MTRQIFDFWTRLWDTTMASKLSLTKRPDLESRIDVTLLFVAGFGRSLIMGDTYALVKAQEHDNSEVRAFN